MSMIQLTNKFVLIQDFLSVEECSKIIIDFELGSKTYLKNSASDVYLREIQSDEICETESIYFTSKSVIDIDDLIADEFKIQPSFDQGAIVKAFPGSSMIWHKDLNSESINYPELNGSDELHEKCSSLGAMIYLNDNFEGGEILFRNGLTFKPKTGSLLIFHGSKHEHRVNAATDFRYNISLWWKYK